MNLQKWQHFKFIVVSLNLLLVVILFTIHVFFLTRWESDWLLSCSSEVRRRWKHLSSSEFIWSTREKVPPTFHLPNSFCVLFSHFCTFIEIHSLWLSGLFRYILSLTVKVYRWWMLQTSLVFLKGKLTVKYFSCLTGGWKHRACPLRGCRHIRNPARNHFNATSEFYKSVEMFIS